MVFSSLPLFSPLFLWIYEGDYDRCFLTVNFAIGSSQGRGPHGEIVPARGRGWGEKDPRKHWRGRGRGIRLPAGTGTGMGGHSLTGNSPLPSLDLSPR
jgi:hypothetical protein